MGQKYIHTAPHTGLPAMQPRFDRGYTGHEMLCGYCLNNPLRYADPSGWENEPLGYAPNGMPFYTVEDYMAYYRYMSEMSSRSSYLNGGSMNFTGGWDTYDVVSNTFGDNMGVPIDFGKILSGEVAAAAGLYTSDNLYFDVTQYSSCIYYTEYYTKRANGPDVYTGTRITGYEYHIKHASWDNQGNYSFESFDFAWGNVAQGGGGWLTAADHTNNGIGGFGAGMSYLGGNFRVNNNSGFSPKFYTKPNAAGKIFSGGFGIKTYNTTNWGKGIGYGSLGVSVVIGGVNVYSAIQKDGGTYGANTQMAVAQSSLGITGAWAGAEIGAAIGVWFGGVGAIPGAVIGGVIGGVVGGWGGSKLGETVVNNFSSY